MANTTPQVIQKDLGLVTAYGYALAGGYQGTEAEFIEDFTRLMMGRHSADYTFDTYNEMVAAIVAGDVEDGATVFCKEEVGVFSYNTLSDKPSINGVELSGDMTSAELNISGEATSMLGGVTMYYTSGNQKKKLGVMGYGNWVSGGSSVEGATINIESDVDYIAFGVRKNPNDSFYTEMLVYVSPNADPTWAANNGYTRGAWNFGADIDMHRWRILNAG